MHKMSILIYIYIMYVMKHGGHHIPNQCLIIIETRAAQQKPTKFALERQNYNLKEIITGNKAVCSRKSFVKILWQICFRF